jgi:hypothetical protein
VEESESAAGILRIDAVVIVTAESHGSGTNAASVTEAFAAAELNSGKW